jgi:hypothetical protein
MNALENTAAALLLATTLLPVPARGDEWDAATAGDVGAFTRNTPAHGSEQVHDLATVGTTADQDWYKVPLRPMSSYQMVIDGQTGDVALQSGDFQRIAQTGVILQNAVETDAGGVLDLSWMQGQSVDTQLIRVMGAACNATACDGSDRYRVRFYETTYTIPRFNNTATQTTVLLIRNDTDRECEAAYYLVTSTGVVATGGDLFPHGMHVINTAEFAPNQSGSVRIAHNCGYGAFTGKAVALEPATGFTFDTLMRHRAN